MPVEPTLGEVVRHLEAVHADLKEGSRAAGVQLNGKVSSDVFELRIAVLDEHLQAVAARAVGVKQADREQAADRRWIFSALIVPIGLVALQAYLTAKGAGS